MAAIETQPDRTSPMDRRLALKCARCGAKAGEWCVTPSGRKTSTHEVRWDASRVKLRSGAAVWRLVHDDPDFGLAADDLLLCVPYGLENGKQTVLARLSDRLDPGCNQYNKDLEFIGFADDVLADPNEADAYNQEARAAVEEWSASLRQMWPVAFA